MTEIGRVAILGAGQIGTMLGQSLMETGADPGPAAVAIFDRNPAVARASVALGGAQVALERAETALDADTVILAMPVDEIVRWVEEWGGRLHPGTLLIDTGSAKGQVVAAMRTFVGESVNAVGGHPICGNEMSGPGAARRGVLQGATFALTPVRTDHVALARATALVRRLGAVPLQLSWERHDHILARVSHLPHLLATALAGVCARADDDRELVRAMVGTGYLGASRLAEANPDMVASFVLANSAEVAEALEEFGRELMVVAQTIGAGGESLRSALTHGSESRRQLVALSA
jgi:prephenate dehydrogenase